MHEIELHLSDVEAALLEAVEALNLATIEGADALRARAQELVDDAAGIEAEVADRWRVALSKIAIAHDHDGVPEDARIYGLRDRSEPTVIRWEAEGEEPPLMKVCLYEDCDEEPVDGIVWCAEHESGVVGAVAAVEAAAMETDPDLQPLEVDPESMPF